jgi:hypothetical protein
MDGPAIRQQPSIAAALSCGTRSEGCVGGAIASPPNLCAIGVGQWTGVR